MAPSDWELFNCSEAYEIDYVVGLYKESQRADVRKYIKDKCADKSIKNATRKDLYDLLEKAGYAKVK